MTQEFLAYAYRKVKHRPIEVSDTVPAYRIYRREDSGGMVTYQAVTIDEETPTGSGGYPNLQWLLDVKNSTLEIPIPR